MQTKEFRIGNIVEWNKEPFIICVIHENWVENKLWSKPIDEIHPIRLTEEILLKCGFEKDNGYIFEHKSGVVFDAPNDWNNTEGYPIGIDCPTTIWGYNPELIIIRCLYLHDLQNKFFAITGEELQVNLEDYDKRRI